ncbi:MAG: hypothetical protein H7230_00825, partial [Candidatus Parcubacteria bacterium]|nr:hypothetical protein [Candidatus Paceibacterota bacterium]
PNTTLGNPIPAGTTVTITDTTTPAITFTAVINTNGTYSQSLPAGTYSVTVVAPIGYTITGSPLSNPTIVTVVPGQSKDAGQDGLYFITSISGYVFNDKANNGAKDTIDLPILGVTILLTGRDINNQNVNKPAVTDTTGKYIFDSLLPGLYVITETQPIPYLDGIASVGTGAKTQGTLSYNTQSDIQLESGNLSINNNFAELVSTAIAGFTFNDSNNNGQKDAGDIGIKDVTIKLSGIDDRGSVIDLSTQTNNDGYYQFKDLRPGNYTITEIQPNNYLDGKDSLGTNKTNATLSNDKIANINLGESIVSANNNFGELTPSSIGDTVWIDTNNNGIQDIGEPGLKDVNIQLSGSDDLGAVTKTTLTDINGKYQFQNLRPGNYSLVATIPVVTNKYRVTTKNVIPANIEKDSDFALDTGGLTASLNNINVTSDYINLSYDLGLYQSINISGYIWEDADKNGLQDNTEEYIPNIEVKLYLSSGVQVFVNIDGEDISKIVTDSKGDYRFDKLSPGEYYLIFAKPKYTVFTTKVTSDGSKNSDVDNNGKTKTYTFTSGQIITNIDAAIQPPPQEIIITDPVPCGGDIFGKVDKFNLLGANFVKLTMTEKATGKAYTFELPTQSDGKYQLKIEYYDSTKSNYVQAGNYRINYSTVDYRGRAIGGEYDSEIKQFEKCLPLKPVEPTPLASMITLIRTGERKSFVILLSIVLTLTGTVGVSIYKRK